ncbi:SDR family oxidoreductase [Nocardia flavorosea]|uniref:SDR family oxidoreductase n=1 Tax=Nocardia flavorosea TaxID=53429 RepID=A0A846YEP8_9NOCA|nr:SDR family oxidoreductase [Nocardia flavorosea]NKY56172.1 SDR family oxidoreductase [Nocardia flavorosea]
MKTDVSVVVGVGGMGRAVAARIGSGRHLFLADFDERLLTEAAAQFTEQGFEVSTHQVDAGDPASVAELAAAAAATGPIRHLVHTAGVSPVKASTEAIVRVDLCGVAYVLDEFAPLMARGAAGVVIASMAGHLAQLTAEQETALAATPTAELAGLPFLNPEPALHPMLAYPIAKRGATIRVQAAAGAWGRSGARVNSISPGVISTAQGRDELAGESGARMRQMIEQSATGRIGTAEDIAAAATYLLDPASSFVTGTDLLVDGGVVATMRAAMRG